MQPRLVIIYIKSGAFTKIFNTSAHRCVIIDQHVIKWQIIRVMAKKPTKRQRIQTDFNDVQKHLDGVLAGFRQISAVWRRDLASYKQEMNMELF